MLSSTWRSSASSQSLGLRFVTAMRLSELKLGSTWILLVTRRVKGYTRFVEKYVTGRRKRFRPYKVYIFLIRITSRVNLAKAVCVSVRMNA